MIDNIPLHPMIVHFPIVIATFLPLMILIMILGTKMWNWSPKIWFLIPSISGLLFVFSYISQETGEIEEERVEEVVVETYLEHHEELAEGFVTLTGILFLLSLLPLFKVNNDLLKVPALLLSLFLVYQTIRVGHSGAGLTYKYGAAKAPSVQHLNYDD